MKDKNNLDKIILHRMEKLTRLRESGIDPYPHNANSSISIDELVEQFSEFMDSGKSIAALDGKTVSGKRLNVHTALLDARSNECCSTLYFREGDWR